MSSIRLADGNTIHNGDTVHDDNLQEDGIFLGFDPEYGDAMFRFSGYDDTEYTNTVSGIGAGSKYSHIQTRQS